MNLEDNGSHFLLGKSNFFAGYELDDVFESSHVHELYDLLDQSIVEEAGIKLDEVFTVSSREVLSEIIE